MVADRVTLALRAGNGGDGALSFRREKFVPHGGPDGGDGGRGGDVVVLSSPQRSSLGEYRHRTRWHAHAGGAGTGAKKHGRDGESVVLEVPCGTVVRDSATGQVLGDLLEPGARVLVARGGRGGRGNSRFASSVQQAPRFSEKGEPGEQRSIELEFKLLTDVGLVGRPNAGKSSLLAALSGAHPKIADYPFTTLEPQLGVAELPDHHQIVLADIPGLITGASSGAGLGLDFLRHVERVRVICHVLDGSLPDVESLVASYREVRQELESYGAGLAQKTEIVALNKCDLPQVEARLPALHASLGGEVVGISALTGSGCRELLQRLGELVSQARLAEAEAVAASDGGGPKSAPRVYPGPPARASYVVSKSGTGYIVHGAEVERWVKMTDLQQTDAVRRLQRRLEKAGVSAALARQGANPGDSVIIAGHEFEYQP